MSTVHPRKISPTAWTIAATLATLWCRIRLKLRVDAKTRPPDGPLLVCAKHASAFDILVLGPLMRKLVGKRPHFEMGSFVGYKLFARIVPLLRALGGFEVMRPKEVRRLARLKGWGRSSAIERMRVVNEQAEENRRVILRKDGVLVFFPEGTRDEAMLRPLVSEREVSSALAVARDGTTVWAWPVSIALAPKRLFRRRAEIVFGAPFALDKASGEPAGVLADVEASWRGTWRSQEELANAPK